MTNEQSSELAEPGVGSFNDPAAFVAAQLAAIFIAPVPAVASVGHDQLDAAFLQPLAQWVLLTSEADQTILCKQQYPA